VNKGDLIEVVAKEANLTKKDAGAVIDAVLDAIRRNTKRGVSLAGFGSFGVSKRKPRNGRNPRTGEAITIPASKTVRFRAGKEFKELL
jgi:DNA-binding protein HU-beta